MFKSVLFATGGALALAGCSGSALDAPDATATQNSGAAVTSEAPPRAPAAAVAPSASENSPLTSAERTPSVPPPPPPPSLLPPPVPLKQAEKGEPGARAVLRTWASALESHQFGIAWELFGNPASSRAAYTKWWQRYRTIHVTLGAGEGDAAMGSLYYTAPATLTGTTVAGKPFRLHGDVVVRRVNDVDGATPAQLRWHIGTADLKEVGPS